MRWPPTRRPGVPAAARSRLDADERVLAWALTAADDALVVTPQGLWLPWVDRIPWHLVTHVTWSGTTLTVTAAAEVSPGVLENLPPVSVRLPEPGTVPETVQQRFYGSRRFSARHRLSGGDGVIIVARRVPGVDGLAWYAVYDDPAQREDPVAAAEVERLLAEAQEL